MNESNVNSNEIVFEMPQDEYAQLLKKNFSQHGTFVHAEEIKPGARNVILIKANHGTAESVEVFSYLPRALDMFIEHNKAVYCSLREATRLFGDNVRVLLERFDKPLDQSDALLDTALKQAADVVNLGLKGDFRNYDIIRNSILQKNHNAAPGVELLNGMQQFAGQCYGRYNHLILPGKSPNAKKVFSVANDFRALVVKAQQQVILDSEYTDFLKNAIHQTDEDHLKNHTHVANMIKGCPTNVHTVVVGYGGSHTSYGHHQYPGHVSNAPIEQFLTDDRIFVFEPNHYNEVGKIPDEVRDTVLVLGEDDVTFLKNLVRREINRLKLPST